MTLNICIETQVQIKQNNQFSLLRRNDCDSALGRSVVCDCGISHGSTLAHPSKEISEGSISREVTASLLWGSQGVTMIGYLEQGCTTTIHIMQVN